MLILFASIILNPGPLRGGTEGTSYLGLVSHKQINRSWHPQLMCKAQHILLTPNEDLFWRTHIFRAKKQGPK